MTRLRRLLAPLALIVVGAPVAPALASPGDLDPTYNGGRPLVDHLAGDDAARDIVVQPDGKIVVLVGLSAGGSDSSALIRYDADGTRDAGFGNDGVRTIEATEDGGWSLEGLALQGDAIVVAGTSYEQDAPDPQNLVAIRYGSAGELDTSFGDEGYAYASTGEVNDAGYGVVVDAQDRVLLLGHGSSGTASGADTVVARFTADGTPDGSFGSGGLVTLPGTSFAGGMALDAAGRILVVSDDGDSANADIVVARLLDDGALDPDFGSAGYATTDVQDADFASAVAVQPDGSVVVAGVADNAGNGQPIVLRYGPDGAVDASFGFAGVAVFEFADRAPGEYQSAQGIELAPDGGVYTVNGGPGPARVGRVSADGEFAMLASIPVAPDDADDQDTEVVSLASAPGGELIVGGAVEVLGQRDLFTLRLLTGEDAEPPIVTPGSPPAPPQGAPAPPARPAGAPDVRGPRLRLASPASRGCVRRPFRLRVRAFDARGIRRIAVRLDGRVLRDRRYDKAGVRHRRAVLRVGARRLGAGPHRIVVRATDRAGNVTRRLLRFRRCG